MKVKLQKACIHLNSKEIPHVGQNDYHFGQFLSMEKVKSVTVVFPVWVLVIDVFRMGLFSELYNYRP